MTSRDKALITAYAALAAAALIATQTVLVLHFRDGGTIGSFLDDSGASMAARFTGIDLLTVATVAIVFMVVETRRLRLKRLWLYVLLTATVAISVAFPLFLIERQLQVTRSERELAPRPA